MVLTIPCYDFLKRRRTRCDVKKFYVRQRYLEDCHEEDQKVLGQSHHEAEQDHSNERRKRKIDSILAKVTLAVNIVMIVAKVFAAYTSNSLSVLSTVVDSFMDITSGACIWYALRAMKNVDKEKYPVGKGRLEPLIIVVVAVTMVFANLIIVCLSTAKIITSNIGPMVDWKTIAIMLTGTTLKLILFILCKRQNTTSSNVLAQDQRNDVLTNSFALVGAYIGHHYWLYADPMGALLLCAYIIANWLKTAQEQVPLLIGKAADGLFTNRIAKIAIAHDERILALDTIYVYHLGVNYLVELHVLMDADLSLRDAHDVSESLQQKIERLPYVERAFVHCDYELDGDEHLKKYK